MITPLRPLRHCLAIIALVGALLGGLIPSGWMPEAHGDGGFSLVICTADGPVVLTLDEHGQPVEADALTSPTDTRCDFAGLSALATLPDAHALQAMVHSQSLVIRAHSEALARNPVSLPGQRGPPSSPEFLSVSA